MLNVLSKWKLPWGNRVVLHVFVEREGEGQTCSFRDYFLRDDYEVGKENESKGTCAPAFKLREQLSECPRVWPLPRDV